MPDLFDGFKKTKEYLVCIDSDGCAMDTMDIKHIRCFGPSMVQEWELWKWEEEAKFYWNKVSLYSMTRGINRFKGLYETLKYVDTHITPIEGLEDLAYFVTDSRELSNPALKRYIEKTDSPMLKKCLRWSEAVNAKIRQLTDSDRLAFDGVKEALELLKEQADSKDYCIGRLLEKGYDKAKAIMIGDAPGDMSAARKCGIAFYPIEVRKETESWKLFREQAAKEFFAGSYAGKAEEEYIEAFEKNLA